MWKEKINFIGSLLEKQSPKILAKSLWMIGEMGLIYPQDIIPYLEIIASYLNSHDQLLRSRSITALGRIGRADYTLIEKYWGKMFSLSTDECPNVRLNFIWANENIATNTPTAYEKYISVFVQLLDDVNDRVRIEAPEMFRVLGKRKPEYVRQYINKLTYLKENDAEQVVRIHAGGAIKAILSEK